MTPEEAADIDRLARLTQAELRALRDKARAELQNTRRALSGDQPDQDQPDHDVADQDDQDTPASLAARVRFEAIIARDQEGPRTNTAAGKIPASARDRLEEGLEEKPRTDLNTIKELGLAPEDVDFIQPGELQELISNYGGRISDENRDEIASSVLAINLSRKHPGPAGIW